MIKKELSPHIQKVYKEDPADEPFRQEREELSFKEECWLYRTRIFFLALASFCTASVIMTFLWHLITKPEWHWLDVVEVNSIKELAVTIIVGLVMSGATTYFFKKKS